jgi:cell division protein FtsI (penicillin-binding protein 3)
MVDIASIARRARKTPRPNSNISFSDTPALKKKSDPFFRSRIVLALVFLAFAALFARAMWIQGPGNEFYEKEGRKRVERRVEMPASRGRIFDRNGIILATSLPVKAIWVQPEDFMERASEEKITAFAALLEMKPDEVRSKVAENTKKGFVYIKRQVPEDIAKKIAELKVPGVYQQKEYRRSYPEGEVAAHVVGFTNIEDKGQEGVELSKQNDLAGRKGQRRVVRDRLNQFVEDMGVMIEPRQGQDIYLSLDSRIQYLAFNALREAVEFHKAKAGAIIVVDVLSGEVLALANVPTYDPNQRHHLSGEQLRNRVLTDTFEPGSTMKPFTVALALEKGRIRPDTLINTSGGRLTIGSSTISDTHGADVLTVSQVIQKSSNVGTAKIALQMPPKDMWDMFQSVGLGQAPKIDFPGAVAGRIRPYANWKPIEQATMSYGYGLSASLFQIARAYTIFARDGQLIPVSLYKVGATVNGPQVIRPSTAKANRDGA